MVITDRLIEVACAAYWWHDGVQILTWHDLVAANDYRLPIWRAKMRAALEAINLEVQL